MHDAIELEARGVPTAVIVTSEFVREARVQREALGMSGLAPVVIPHPLSSLTEDEIRSRAAAALPQVLAAWQGRLRDADA
jgi:mannitol/fructose-specific phosphotransferase system IIA component (Ntr-type)